VAAGSINVSMCYVPSTSQEGIFNDSRRQCLTVTAECMHRCDEISVKSGVRQLVDLNSRFYMSTVFMTIIF
jgi:hypothetical protein